jgi:hypothetical protein
MPKFRWIVLILSVLTVFLVPAGASAAAKSAGAATPHRSSASARARIKPDTANVDPVVSAAIEEVPGAVDYRFVFWRCLSDEGLCEANYNGSSWSEHEISGMGSLGSAPTVSLDASLRAGAGANPYQYVFWAGTGNHNLWEAYWNGSWHGPTEISQISNMVGNPAAPEIWYSSTSGFPDAVAWTNNTNGISYSETTTPTTTSSWSSPVNREVGQIASPPSVVDAGGGAESVWWQGDNNDLYSASIGDGGYPTYGACNFGMGPLGSAATVTWEQYLNVSPRKGADHPTAIRPDVSGNCPVNSEGSFWYGTGGQYDACWGAYQANGMWCMDWYNLDALGSSTLDGPWQDGSMGDLGSSPSLAAWGVSPTVIAFWSGTGVNPDLWTTGSNLITNSPVNTGMLLAPP